jgi:RNA polymerase sigma-54 factor
MIIQSQKTATKPVTTAHLAQTMTLMALTAAELRQKIEAELASNPALELLQEHRCPNCHRPLPRSGPCPVCSRPKVPESDQPIVFVSPREDFFVYRGNGKSTYEDHPLEDITAEYEDLPTYVMHQIAPELPVEDRKLAAHLLTSLDEDGLLQVQIADIAQYHHIPMSRVKSVQNLIQRADPLGVGSGTPQEALLVQLDVLKESQEVPPLARRAVEEGLDLLSRHQYKELGRLLDISTQESEKLAQYISDNLNPFPGRAHWGTARQKLEPSEDTYYQPDVIINCLNDDPDSPLVIEIISPLAGKIRVNPRFQKALSKAPEDKIEQWQSDIEHASLLVKCLQQRNHTIVRLMHTLAVIQRDFILKGDAHIKPITRASLSKDLDVHESTISRAVSKKAVQLPSGKIIPLAKFFDRSLHIRTALKKIVAQENTPLTDTQILRLLRKQGHKIARRTVAKYRAMEGILPAHLRHRPQAS